MTSRSINQKPIESASTIRENLEINGKLLLPPNSFSLPDGLPPSPHLFVDAGSARAKVDVLRPQKCMVIKETAKTAIVLLYKRIQ